MSEQLEFGGKHTRDEIATHLENLAANLRNGTPMTITKRDGSGKNQNIQVEPPKNPDFNLDVDQNTSWTGDVKSTELQMIIGWDEEEKTDDEELSIR